jgi:DNA-directed RNA polymerase specialized sigma24 family protein
VPVRVRTSKPWSAQENNTLMMMYYNGVPYSEIAKALNRTVVAVGNRINIYQASMNLTRRKNRSK